MDCSNAGIYTILNKVNGKIYVGQSIDVNRRLNAHRISLNNKNHPNQHLQNAWNKYGEDAFEFNLIEPCEINRLNDNEIWWINYFNSTNEHKGYNLQSGGDVSFTISDETRQKLSESHRGLFNGDKNPMYGKRGHLNPMYGKKHSFETRKKMRENNNSPSGVHHRLYGKHLSEYTRNKISKSLTGHKQSLETKLKNSNSKNSSGYFRVHKQKHNTTKQGYCWVYRYVEDGVRKSISSVSLEKLELKVKEKGLEWIKF